MKYIKTVGIYDICEASKEECKKGWLGMPFEYPCYCAFYKDEEERTFRTSESDFGSIEEAEEWCKEYS